MDTALRELEEMLKAAVLGLKKELGGIRSNRPTPQLVENLTVDYFGESVALKQLGSIGITLPREIHITVWDKNAVPAVVKAIETSPLHLNPQSDGVTIRMNMPPLTEERKLELIKLVKSIAEKARIRVRGLRDDANKKADRALALKRINEDQKFAAKKKIQELVDSNNKEIDQILNGKVREIGE